VYKAESALDALAVSLAKDKDKDAAAALTAPVGSAAAGKKAPGAAERERVQSKLDFANGLSRLGQGHYERAAQAFLKVGSVESLGDWVDTVGIRHGNTLCRR
jgi:COP9 signalosome complex subunit 1